MKKSIRSFLIICLFSLCLQPVLPVNVKAEDLPAQQTTEANEPTENEKLYNALKRVGTAIADAKFKYGKSAKTNFFASQKKRRSFCADYVTWGLQSKGDLPYSMRIYGTRSGKLAGSGKKEILKKYTLITCMKKTKKVNFQPGDVICLYKLSGKFGWHMMVFYKYDKNGHPLWYSGGNDATGKNGYYSKKKLTTPRRLAYYEKGYTAFVLRHK